MRLHDLRAVAVLAFLMALPLGSAAAEKPARGERLLLGFEADEIRRIAADMGIPPPPKKPRFFMSLKEADGGLDLRHHYILGTWRVRPGECSQGALSLAISASGYPFKDRIQRYRHVPPVRLPPAPLPYYQGMGVDGGYRLVFRTAGLFRTIFPADWSGYDLLRLDVRGEGVRQTFRIVLEDEEVEPPVVRNMTVEPGKWTTLEIDLQEAVKVRGLDLRRMAAFYVIVSEGRPVRARLDNIRLCRRGTAAAFRIVRDDSPQELPAYYRASSGPRPQRLPAGRPDRSPIAAGPPFAIDVGEDVTRAPQAAGGVVKPGTEYLAVTPCGWAAAYDNRRLLVGFTGAGGRNVFALQSLDGGKSWRGLDGGERATTVPVPNPDHGAGRGDAVGERADVLLLTSLGCAGTCVPAMRQFAQKLTFTGAGWRLRQAPALVDCDGRHCGSNQSILRLPDGRLWCAFGLVGRLGRIGINVRYSDDDGLVWRSWRPGRSGAIPGSFHPGRGASTYQYEEPCLVAHGEKGIACLWYERPDGTRIGDLKCARFDGTKWSPTETISLGRTVPGKHVSSRPPVHAVSVGGQEIFVVSSRFPGVLHYADGVWKKEAAGQIPAGGRISAAGDKHVLVFSAARQDPKVRDGGIVLRCCQRSADGRWSPPRELAREEAPLLFSKTRPSFVVQAYAPPNFVPIAWTCKGKSWIKYLRVPVAP